MEAKIDWTKGWLEELAREAKFDAEAQLTLAEAEKLGRETGLAVTLWGLKPDKNGLYPYKIGWNFAFVGRFKKDQLAYMNKETDVFPKVENFAQRLYLIAKRAENK